MKKQGRDSWDLGGEGESWNIWIFWQTGEIYGLEWVIAFKQSSPEWNEQGQRRQDPWQISTWLQAGHLWKLTCDAGQRLLLCWRPVGFYICFVLQFSCTTTPKFFAFVTVYAAKQEELIVGFLNNYFSVDGQQDNSDLNGNDFILNCPL